MITDETFVVSGAVACFVVTLDSCGSIRAGVSLGMSMTIGTAGTVAIPTGSEADTADWFSTVSGGMFCSFFATGAAIGRGAGAVNTSVVDVATTSVAITEEGADGWLATNETPIKDANAKRAKTIFIMWVLRILNPVAGTQNPPHG